LASRYCLKSNLASQQLWERYQREAPLVLASYEASPLAPPRKEPLDEFDRLADEIEGELNYPKSQDEFENYNSEPSYGLKMEDPIQWWLDNQQRKRFP
jgi:hypothetical protein